MSRVESSLLVYPGERVTPADEPWEQHRARYLRIAARVAPGMRVLDAGCGIGYGAAILNEAGARVVGVDASAEAIARARAGYPGPDYLVGDVLSLPFADASFDVITCLEVIEHVDDPQRLVRELARMLRRGGALFLSTPNARMERLHERGIGSAENPYHLSPFRPGRLRRLVRRAGLDAVLYGQSRDRGPLHLTLQALDPLGLRLRLAPRRRAVVHRAFGGVSPSTADPPARFGFSRLTARSAAIVFVEATKP
jgi:SAM-dependent methyltransferase